MNQQSAPGSIRGKIALPLLHAALLLVVCGCSSLHRSPKQYRAATIDPAQVERQIHREINAYRHSRRLPPLPRDRELDRVAHSHSEAMEKSKRMSHRGFSRRFDQMKGAGFATLAENVAYNLGVADPGGKAVDNWLRSRGHHGNIVNSSYRRTGIGVVRNRDGGYYFTQLFGSHRGE